MEELLAEAASQTLALGPDRPYASFSYEAASVAPRLLHRLGDRGSLQAWVASPSSPEAGGQVDAPDERFEIVRRPFGDFVANSSQPLAGVLIHLGRPPPGADAVGSRQELEEWLQNVTVEELVSALDAFGSLHDDILSERLAEALLLRRRERGAPACLAEIGEVLEDLRPEFAESHPNLCPGQILRAIGAAARRELERLTELLEASFRRLEPSGRCAVVTFNPWELAALRSFLHSHEEPSSDACTAVAPRRLARLYPLLASGKDYMARRVSKPFQTSSDDVASDEQRRTGMLHVLEKVPRSTSAACRHELAEEPVNGADSPTAIVEPPPPDFGGCTAQDDGGVDGRLDQAGGSDTEEELEQPSPAVAAEMERLQNDIAARKAELREAGQGAAQLKKDPQLSDWIRRLKKFHCNGRKYTEKVHQRCRDRPHISVLLSEAIEHTMFLGADEVYVDCTFGRGGHSRLMLSKLSENGRLKAFDVDPRAVEVGHSLEREDQRFQILHRPFGELPVALQDELGGVLLDLGVSSPQLDDRSRGFSCRSAKSGKSGPLDLRMNPSVGLPASKWLQTVTAGQLAWVISSTCYRLDPPIPERIAEAILERQRRQGPYESTSDLAAVLEDFASELGDERPGTSLAHLVFCSIRVFLNREREQLDVVLEGAFERLKPSGRCVVICFTRWEMAAVRRFVRRHEEPRSVALASAPPQRLQQLYPLLASGARWSVRQARRPVRPTAEEIARNQRAKSMMFVLEKVPR